MGNAKKEAALRAVRNLFSDTTVTPEETKESLEEVAILATELAETIEVEDE